MHAKNYFQSTARFCRQGKLPEHASKHDPNTVPVCLSAAFLKVRVQSSEKFTLLKVSPNFLERNKQIPTTTAKPSLNVLNSYLNPQTIWAFLCISRELSFPQQRSVMDGRAFVSAQMAGPAPLRRVMHFSRLY